MNKYQQYKPTNIEWIGDIPNTWNTLPFKRLTQVKRGASPRPIDDPKYFDENGEFGWVRIADVTASDRYLENTTQKLSELGASLSVKRYPGDLFLSIAGTVGKPIISKIKCCIHDGFVWFPDLKIDPEFLYYIFSAGLAYQGLGKLGTQLNLNTDTVGYINLPLPSKEEICQIVQYLDKNTAKIDNLINKKQKLITLLKEEHAAIINQAVTKGLNLEAEMKDSGIDWLGEIPKHWEIKRIKRLTQVKRGASPRPIDDPKYFDENGEFGWVRIADVSASEKYLEKTEQKLSDLGASLSVKQYPGNLFISIAGTVGKPIISKIKCCIHDGFVWFPNLSLKKEFLYYIFMGGEVYKGLGKLGTQLNLNTDTIGQIFIPIPPSNEIDRIIEFIKSYEEKTTNMMRNLQKEIDLLQEYRTTLISEVVTGKIDVRQEVVS